jgi:hypothetical protein
MLFRQLTIRIVAVEIIVALSLITPPDIIGVGFDALVLRIRPDVYCEPDLKLTRPTGLA